MLLAVAGGTHQRRTEGPRYGGPVGKTRTKPNLRGSRSGLGDLINSSILDFLVSWFSKTEARKPVKAQNFFLSVYPTLILYNQSVENPPRTRTEGPVICQ